MMKPFDPLRPIFVVLLLTLATVPALSQEEPSAAEDLRRAEAIVEIEHADPVDIAKVIAVFSVHVEPHQDLGLITIRGEAGAVEAARAAALQLDRPPEPTASIQVNAYVLDSSKNQPLEGGVPPALEEVAAQLREVFGFQGVELIDTLALRVLDGGQGQVTGTLPETAERPPMPYRLGFNRAEVIPGEKISVRLDGFAFHVRTSGPPSESGEDPESLENVTRLITDLEIRAGQKAVVGKAATPGARQGLIVVVEVTVLE